MHLQILQMLRSLPCTTGGRLFAECLLHSAKPLPSATLDKEPPSNPLPVKAALPSTKFRALGKDLTPSADDRRRLIIFLKKNSLPSATAPALGKEICFLNLFAECHSTGTRQRVFFIFYFLIFFAECNDHCTRQRKFKKI